MPENETKDTKIEKILKLIKDKKLEEALELADINDVEYLLNIGVLFGENKVNDVAEKIFIVIPKSFYINCLDIN